MLLRQRESLLNDLAEAIDGADNMVGREDGDHGVWIVAADHRRAQTNGIERVAARRLAEELRRLQTRYCGQDRLGMFFARADIAALGRHEPFEPLVGDFQQAFAFDKRDELFRQGLAAHRPQPRARTAGENQCVSHNALLRA